MGEVIWSICSLCDGAGELDFNWLDRPGPNDPEAFRCPRCNGEGEVRG